MQRHVIIGYMNGKADVSYTVYLFEQLIYHIKQLTKSSPRHIFVQNTSGSLQLIQYCMFFPVPNNASFLTIFPMTWIHSNLMSVYLEFYVLCDRVRKGPSKVILYACRLLNVNRSFENDKNFWQTEGSGRGGAYIMCLRYFAFTSIPMFSFEPVCLRWSSFFVSFFVHLFRLMSATG